MAVEKEDDTNYVVMIIWIIFAILASYAIGKGVYNYIQRQKMLDKANTQNAGTKESTAPATLNKAQAGALAEQIDKTEGEYTWPDVDSLITAFKEIKNDADFDLVNAEFGVRSEYVSLLSTEDFNMSGFINKFHSPATVKKVNDILSKAGLTKSV